MSPLEMCKDARSSAEISCLSAVQKLRIAAPWYETYFSNLVSLKAAPTTP
jgi:hypothetical protein